MCQIFSSRVNSSFLFYVAFALYYVNAFIDKTSFADDAWTVWFHRLLKVAVLLILIVKLLLQKYTERSMILLILCGSVIGLSYIMCRSQDLVWAFLFIAAAQGISMKRVAKETLLLSLCMTLCIVLLAEMNVISSIVESVSSSSRAYFWSEGDTITLWGFTHHNYLGGEVLLCYLCYVFLRYEKYNISDLIPAAFCFLFCYYAIKSRTSAVVIIILTLLALMLKAAGYLGERFSRIFSELAVYGAMVFSVIFSVVVSLNYSEDSTLCVLLDRIINNRFSFASSIYADYGFSLFGQQVELISTGEAVEMGVSSVILDNVYMHLFIRFGILTGALILIGYFLAVRVKIAKKDYGTAIIIAAIFICGIAERWLMILSENPFLIILACVIYGVDYEQNRTVQC